LRHDCKEVYVETYFFPGFECGRNLPMTENNYFVVLQEFEDLGGGWFPLEFFP